MAVKNLGQVQALWIGTTAPVNTTMLWYDINVGVRLHKYYNSETSLWEPFIINTATEPLFRSGSTIEIHYSTDHFELIDGSLTIKANVLADVTPPFPISDITGLQSALDLKVDRVIGKSLIADTEIARLALVVNYTHPVNHLPSIISQDSNNRFVTDAQISEWNAKQNNLGYVPYDSSNPEGFINDSYFVNNKFMKVYTIVLPSAGSVQARVDASTEGTNYPSGWVLSADIDNSHDLSIVHNLSRSMVNVYISQVTGTRKKRLQGNVQYSGLTEKNLNEIVIEGLATVPFVIEISIILA